MAKRVSMPTHHVDLRMASNSQLYQPSDSEIHSIERQAINLSARGCRLPVPNGYIHVPREKDKS